MESDKELKNLRKATAALWKVAKASQLEFKKQRKADEAEAKAKVEEEAKAKEAAEVAAAEVRSQGGPDYAGLLLYGLLLMTA